MGSQILIDIYIKLIAPLQCAQQDLFQKPNINNGLLNYITFNFSFFSFFSLNSHLQYNRNDLCPFTQGSFLF